MVVFAHRAQPRRAAVTLLHGVRAAAGELAARPFALAEFLLRGHLDVLRPLEGRSGMGTEPIRSWV